MSTVEEILRVWRSVDRETESIGSLNPENAYQTINGDWNLTFGNNYNSLNDALRFGVESEYTRLLAANRIVLESRHKRLSHLINVFVEGFNPVQERNEIQNVLRRLVVDGSQDIRTATAEQIIKGWGAPALVATVKRDTEDQTRTHVELCSYPLPFPAQWYVDNALGEEYIEHMTFMCEESGVDLSGQEIAQAFELDSRVADATVRAADTSGQTPTQAKLEDGGVLSSIATDLGPGTRVSIRARDSAAVSEWFGASKSMRERWLAVRAIYELAPFVSERALRKNSMYFAGKVLSKNKPRPRPDRLAAFLKTVAPAESDVFYSRYSDNRAKIKDATNLAALVKAAAICDVESLRSLEVTAVNRLKAVKFAVESSGAPVNAYEEIAAPTSVISAVTTSSESKVRAMVDINDGATIAPQELLRGLSTSIHYKNSSNSVSFPLAMLSYPIFSKTGGALANAAYFGVIVGHEMAHSIAPRDAHTIVKWFEDMHLDSEFKAACQTGRISNLTQARELLCDMLGIRWAWRAYENTRGSNANTTENELKTFLTLAVTRFRGVQGRDVGVASSRPSHPDPVLRATFASVLINHCNLGGGARVSKRLA